MSYDNRDTPNKSRKRPETEANDQKISEKEVNDQKKVKKERKVFLLSYLKYCSWHVLVDFLFHAFWTGGETETVFSEP